MCSNEKITKCNAVTTLLGVALLVYGSYVVGSSERSMWELIPVVGCSSYLIWFKNNKARELLEKVIDKSKKL